MYCFVWACSIVSTNTFAAPSFLWSEVKYPHDNRTLIWDCFEFMNVEQFLRCILHFLWSKQCARYLWHCLKIPYIWKVIFCILFNGFRGNCFATPSTSENNTHSQLPWNTDTVQMAHISFWQNCRVKSLAKVCVFLVRRINSELDLASYLPRSKSHETLVTEG